jgi:hypothetical protein
MKPLQILAAVFFIIFSMNAPAGAAEKGENLPWKKAYLNLGGQLAALDSGFKLSSQAAGIGIDLDVEDALELETSQNIFRVDAGWRFTKNKRHKAEFSWFRFDRSGTRFLNQAIEIPDGEGGSTSIGPGQLQSDFKLDVYKLKYEYSAILDDRFDLNLGVGVYVMPVKFGFTGTLNGAGQEKLSEDITAPLPVLGLGFDFAITSKWFLRQQTDLFYLELGDFRGGIVSSNIAVEYLPWKWAGFGLAFDSMKLTVEAEGNDYPGVDFNGAVNISYIGALLYLKMYL